MVHVYSLVRTEVGTSSVVAAAIPELPGVSMAEAVTGPYDLIARVAADSVTNLGR